MPEQPRPKWAEAVRWFITDDILDDKYEFPEDGTDDTVLEEVEAAVLGVLCRAYGHKITDDQCGIPEHRFCVYCGRRETDIAADAP